MRGALDLRGEATERKIKIKKKKQEKRGQTNRRYGILAK